MHSNVEVIGVEPENVASYAAAIKAGHPVNGFKEATLADGLAVPIVGMASASDKTFSAVRTISPVNVCRNENETGLTFSFNLPPKDPHLSTWPENMWTTRARCLRK